MRMIRNIALAVMAVAGATTAQATIFSDGTMAGWTPVTEILDPGSSFGGATNPGSGGNPGSYLQFTQTAVERIAEDYFSGFTWNPSTQGAISDMHVEYDGKWISGSFQGDTRIGLDAILRQGGQTYYALYNEVSNSSWSHFAGDLTQIDWCIYGNCGVHPNFSATGGLIEFGLSSLNTCPGGCTKTLSGGLDNYSIELRTINTAVPEPQTMWLMLAGLAGMLGASSLARHRKGELL